MRFMCSRLSLSLLKETVSISSVIQRASSNRRWVQIMYLEPPREIIPPSLQFEDLRTMTFEEWTQRNCRQYKQLWGHDNEPKKNLGPVKMSK